MVLRYPNMRANYLAAQNQISRCCRDLCGQGLDMTEKFTKLHNQFYIMPNGDIFIDDSMCEEEYGYILKCLRTVDLLDAEIIVPKQHT